MLDLEQAAGRKRRAQADRLAVQTQVENDRQLTPPPPEGPDEISAALKFLTKKAGSKNEQWPTIADIRKKLGMPRNKIMKLLGGGRHPSRNVWKGSPASTAKKGGRPRLRITPVGLEIILRAFLRQVKWPAPATKKILLSLRVQKV